MESSMTPEDVGETLAILTLEIMAAVYSNAEDPAMALETVASHLLDSERDLIDGPVRDALRSLAHTLVKAEI